MRKIFHRTYSCKLCLESSELHGSYFANTIQEYNFTENIFAIQDQKVNLAIILTSIKRSLTLF